MVIVINIWQKLSNIEREVTLIGIGGSIMNAEENDLAPDGRAIASKER